ncbi:MAG: hypothetical protein JJ975_17410 [Bacteroidia bacterium]|nr:hypothetical protein [Bacteroidia bacterium]
MKTYVLKCKLLWCLVFLAACGSTAQTSLQKLETWSEFQRFSGPPLSAKYGHVSSVKIVYDLEREQLHFINSSLFRYHIDFCRDVLMYQHSLEHFNMVNYGNHRRQRFLLGTINYFETLDTYALELSTSDHMSLKRLLHFYDLVKHSVYFEKFSILLNNLRLQSGSTYLESEAAVLHPDEIYKNLNLQVVSKGQTYGRLRIVSNFKDEKKTFKPQDVLVLNETPLYLPRVAGIIVTEFQTPLSHLTILGQNRKIPICAFKTALQNEHLQALNGSFVRFQVRSDTFLVESAKRKNQEKKRPRSVKLKYDLTVDSLITIDNVSKHMSKSIGNKAKNFAVLKRLSTNLGYKTPESAFVIPFFYYDQHVQQTGTQRLIDTLLNAERVRDNLDSVEYYLKKIRKRIKKGTLDNGLLVDVNNRIVALGPYRRMRFRSSTNAEDARGFSGAGLYTSKTGIVGDSSKPIDKAIKKVWASLWSLEAFLERDYFGIDHSEAFMGILVHRSFPNESVNGVVITKNLYRRDYHGFVVNAQWGEESVVKPKPGVVCDQFICYPDDVETEGRAPIDIIALSNIGNGVLAMTQFEIQQLANDLESVKDYFFKHSFSGRSYWDYGLDVEFKIDGVNRQLYLKQARFYND